MTETISIENRDGTQTSARIAGNVGSQAIVLLHGIGADHRMWDPQIQVLSQNGYYVLAPDLLGHGKTSKVSELNLENWEDQLLELLFYAGVSKCILVGVSMGGVIAQSFAMNYPEKIHKLILADTFGELKTCREKVLGFLQITAYSILKVSGHKILAKGMELTYKAPFAHMAKEYFCQMSLTADFEQLILARKAINKIKAIGKIDGDQISTLVLVGHQSGKSFVEINRKIADAITGSRFVILKNSMDPSNLVNETDFNREVLQFLQNPT
ncbi:3-oxoadipate enol-lactonase [Desulfomarina profundi]|uniref:3-oxoadipate enol-lactonase n=1 Tax=Desulfomarina profundi TaxID=2772557 RepID=A0A8D5FNT9_9BACT|nr:alpha/beta hydrolase [Desulfomarina profundi]BCL62543.1 3-oxoadipate enol-lactonase [Desulfomarina profundi]